MGHKRILIVGGVAGGASAAARARRLSESAEIIIFERGPHVSFANCGLPYYIGGEIEEESDLLLQTPESLRTKLNLDVRVNTEIVEIDRAARQVTAIDRTTGRTYHESYDALLLSTGAAPLRPPIPGIDHRGHFTVRNVPDAAAIVEWVEARSAHRAVVVGGGYIGLELAEQLRHRGLHVTIVEALPQVMGLLDSELAALLHAEIRSNGVDLRLSDGVASFDEPGPDESAGASVVVLRSGERLPADIVVLGLGVKPDVALARLAGLEIGELGGIRVNERLQTSDPAIWAVGDAIEVRNRVTGTWALIPLAGPANRQGRIAAANMLGGSQCYKGTWGTGILRVFGLTAAATGASERTLRAAGVKYHAIHLHPGSHAGYFPGAEPIDMKVLFAAEDGKVLGAQAVGRDGVDKRMDVLATALQAGLTATGLADLELDYAPPFSGARDPVNMAGMICENVLNGLVKLAQWHEIPNLDPAQVILLDVRDPDEVVDGAIPGAINIPLSQLRSRLAELPRDKEIITYCMVGQRSYYASRILAQNGFRCRNLTGAYRTWAAAQAQ